MTCFNATITFITVALTMMNASSSHEGLHGDKNVSSHQDVWLELTRYDIYVHLLPVIICMTVFAAVGIVGNILTLLFYSMKTKRSSSRIQIISLSVADLLVCLLIVPNILEMVANVAHNHPFLCKIAHFSGLWTIASSCLILWVVAIDRHRKICRPFVSQMTIKSTKRSVCGVVLFGFCMAVRNFANFDTVPVNVSVTGLNRTITGRFCTTRDDDQYKLSVTIFTVVDFALFLMVWFTLIIVYPHIVYTLIKIKRRKQGMFPRSRMKGHEMRDLRTEASETSFDFLENTEHKSSISYITNDNLTSDESPYASTSGSCSRQHCVVLDDKSGPNPSNILRNRAQSRIRRRRKRKLRVTKSAKEKSMTLMMLTVSIVFVVCFLPYFVIKIIMRLVLHTGEEFELGVGIQLVLRLVYLNSVFNPIVYCVFNPKFRRYIKNTSRSFVKIPHNFVRNSLHLK